MKKSPQYAGLYVGEHSLHIENSLIMAANVLHDRPTSESKMKQSSATTASFAIINKSNIDHEPVQPCSRPRILFKCHFSVSFCVADSRRGGGIL